MDELRTVACQKCGAVVGEPCVMPDGRVKTGYHSARWNQLWLTRGRRASLEWDYSGGCWVVK
jgi:hypothetical protein